MLHSGSNLLDLIKVSYQEMNQGLQKKIAVTMFYVVNKQFCHVTKSVGKLKIISDSKQFLIDLSVIFPCFLSKFK